MRSMAATRLLAWTVAVPLVAPARPSHRSKLTGLQDGRVTGSFCLKLRAWIVGGLGVAQPGAGPKPKTAARCSGQARPVRASSMLRSSRSCSAVTLSTLRSRLTAIPAKPQRLPQSLNPAGLCAGPAIRVDHVA